MGNEGNRSMTSAADGTRQQSCCDKKGSFVTTKMVALVIFISGFFVSVSSMFTAAYMQSISNWSANSFNTLAVVTGILSVLVPLVILTAEMESQRLRR